MPKFANLRRLEVKADKTVPYTFYEIEGEPVLHVAPATEANKPYFNQLLKSSRKNQRRIQKGSFTAAVIAENRENDKELYPKFIVRSWEKVNDSDGTKVPFTEQNVREFLNALPDYLFDDLRNFASDSQSFVEDIVDPEEVSGN